MTGNDPVLPADPLEHHLRRPGLVEAASELLAIVAEYLVRDAEALQRLNKRQAHRTARRRSDHGGDDAEPGMIVHPGDHFASPPSANWMPPTMSSCHSSIGTSRCHR